MRITLTEDASGRKAGETFDLTNEAKAKGLIDAGMAKAAPAPEPGNDGGIDPATERVIRETMKAMAAGAVEGAASKTARPEVRIESTGDAALEGLKIFGSHGGFLHAVKMGTATNPDRDSVEKLGDWEDMQRKAGVGRNDFHSKAPSGNFEGNDPDGGALVLPEFSQQIIERIVMYDDYLAETDVMVIRGNTMTFPALDDKSRLDGFRSGGILGAYADEAGFLANVSKVSFRQMTERLKKLYVFAYMTDELLSDSAYALEQYVAKKVAEELVFKRNDGLFRGNGSGQPMGFLVSPCKITVAKETNQAAGTILNLNVEKMWQRCNAAHRKNAVWLINQDCESALQQMALPIGISGVPTYMPVGGLSNPSFATLKGRPVKVSEFSESLGTEGDISLVDWGAFQSITKGGIKTDMSMHVRFQYGEMAYRFTYRFDSQPKYDAPLTPYKGTNTTSPIVTLATRS